MAGHDVFLRKQKQPSCFTSLRQHASKFEISLLLVGCIASVISGAMMPLTTILIGSSISIYVHANEQEDAAQLTEKVNKRVVLLCAIAAGAVVASYIQSICWMISAQRISARIRRAYFRALLQKDFPSLDGIGTGKLTDTMSSSMITLQDTLSQKTAIFVSSLSTFVSAFVVSLVRNWKLALILCTILPAMFVVTLAMSIQVARYTQQVSAHIVQAHDIVSEAVSAIKVVQTLQAQDTFAKQYRDSLQRASRIQWRKSAWQAAIWGWVYFARFGVYALALWEGSRLLVSENIDIGIIINILYSVIIGTMALSRVSRSLHEFGIAISLANEIFETIHSSDNGKTGRGALQQQQQQHSTQIIGEVSFRNVDFAYPSRPEVLVLDGLDLNIWPGQTTAIVGYSGAGKSTITGLIQQFYRPTGGKIYIDDRSLNSIDFCGLRSQISFVSQDPTFFSMSVLENVRLGLLGTPYDIWPSEEQEKLVREACKLVGISGVIEGLPQGYNTLLGSRGGVLLSGGEKQRLAFARAIIRNPRILILDEPTSALDKESEAHVQSALRQVAPSRTVIVIAHRLDTIKNADCIVVLEAGNVVEQGTHAQLMQYGNVYRSLFTLQGKGNFTLQNDILRQPTKTAILDRNKDELDATFAEQNSTQALPESSTALRPQNVVQHCVQLLRFNQPEWHLLITGNIASAISGCLYPFQALLFAKAIAAEQYSGGTSQRPISHYALFFFVIAIISSLSHLTSNFASALSFDKMVARARSVSFQGILRKDIDWFSAQANSSSSLVFLLLRQYLDLAGLHAQSISILLEIATNMASVSIFSIVIAWRYALVLLTVIPLMFVSYYFRIRTIRTFLNSMTKWHRESGEMACEAISAIRTVASLGAENYFVSLYSQHLAVASKVASESVWKQSIVFAVTQGLTFGVNAFAIWYGSRLMGDKSIDLYQFFAVFIALTFGAQDSGEMISLLPDLSQAVVAAERLTEVSPDKKEEESPGQNPAIHHGVGEISFHDVSFRYPHSPAPAIHNLNMMIKEGQNVAIIGPSGSGKSTVINLLATLYKPSSGRISFSEQEKISIDGPEECSSYQSLLSLVPQESNIFTGSIRHNIILGNAKATDKQIHNVCRQVGILDFIQSLPSGFDTICGPKELSVGQRQRIAFARALVRNPKVMLFDEPTASLDARSAHQIMSTIRSFGGDGRITVTVTHSAANAVWADVVFVFIGGKVVESGSPQDLMRLDGYFAQIMATDHWT